MLSIAIASSSDTSSLSPPHTVEPHVMTAPLVLRAANAESVEKMCWTSPDNLSFTPVLSPPNLGFPHVTTALLDFTAANALAVEKMFRTSASIRCCTPLLQPPKKWISPSDDSSTSLNCRKSSHCGIHMLNSSSQLVLSICTFTTTFWLAPCNNRAT